MKRAVIVVTGMICALPANAFALEAELGAKSLKLAGTEIGLEPLTIRGALAKARGNEAVLALSLSNERETTGLLAVLRGASGTELDRVELRLASGAISIPLHRALGPEPTPVVLEKGKLNVPSGEHSIDWEPGAREQERLARQAFKQLCQQTPCAFELNVPAEANALPLLESWHSVTAGLTHLSFTVRQAPTRGQTTVSGRLAPTEIQAVVRRNFAKFGACYEPALARTPTLAGRVNVGFVIERDGKVSHAVDKGSDLPNPAVVECVVKAFASLEFPKPEAGIVAVVYPIAFDPR